MKEVTNRSLAGTSGTLRSGALLDAWPLRHMGRALVLAFALAGAGCQDGTMAMDDPTVTPEQLTDLDKYVKAKDPSYSWTLRQTDKGAGYTAYLIDMKSLTWRTAQEVDRPLWQHNLTIVKPDNLTPGPAVIAISGGSNGGTPPTKAESEMVQIAKAAGCVVINLSQVPNEPLTFSGHDGKSHTEDGIIAFSWAQVMKTKDPTWSARFPMVKSSVLAMDTAQEFLKSSAGGSLNIDKFIVAGASKRGWTTWLTAAVDPRVVAAIPIVIDVLNVEKFMTQHIETYGFWARSLYDYHYNHITEHIGTPELDFMLRNEDPYLFRKRLTMPKYVVNASGDQFFLPDGSQNYWDDLPGDKYLRYVPNADHSLDGSDALESVVAYVQGFRDDKARPTFTWKFEGTDSIRVQSSDKPTKVQLWQATNPKARDFRVETLGKVWKATDLTDQGGGVFVGQVPMPAQGFTAFYLEMTYPSGQLFPYKFSSQIRVLPEKRPFTGMDPKTGKLEATGP